MHFHSICILALIGFIQAKQNLRHKEPKSRQLKVTELVHFSAIIHVRASDETSNRKTSSEEDKGALVGFRNWFQENSEAFYSSNPSYGVEYSSTGCELNKEESTTHITTSGEDYHHSIAISCQSTVLLDNSYDITSKALVDTAAVNYPHNSLPNYLDAASPANSPFGFPALQRIELELLSPSTSYGSVTYTLPPKPLAEEESTSGRNSTARARRTMPPVPSAQEDGSVGEDDTDTPARGTIPIVLEWEVSMHPNFQNQGPSKMESYSFMEATRSWMFDSIYEYYGDKDVATWNGVVNAFILEPSHDETEPYSHTITIHYDAEFEEVSTGEEFYRSKLMLVMALTDQGAEGLQRDYLPNTGLFQASHVSRVAFHINE